MARTLILASRTRGDGSPVYNLGGEAVDLTDWVLAIEDAVPEAAGLISVASTELPFPSDIAHDRIAELGDVPVTPFRDAIAETAAIYRRLAEEGRLIGSEQGVPVQAAAAG